MERQAWRGVSRSRRSPALQIHRTLHTLNGGGPPAPRPRQPTAKRPAEDRLGVVVVLRGRSDAVGGAGRLTVTSATRSRMMPAPWPPSSSPTACWDAKAGAGAPVRIRAVLRCGLLRLEVADNGSGAMSLSDVLSRRRRGLRPAYRPE